VLPFNTFCFFADVNISILFIFAISGLAVYGVILSGWASNSKYAFFGAIRSAAQMVSYEVSIGLILMSSLFCVGSLNFIDIVFFQNFIFFFYHFYLYFLCF
jgi:NADH-quinone oxidoreductase subunit H